MSFKFPEQYRTRKGPFASSLEADGLNGAGFIPIPPNVSRDRLAPLKFIASCGDHPEGLPPDIIAAGAHEWEHVSVSLPHRCPTWGEMCYVKSLFWDDEDCVMQLHPPRSDWVNNHPYCLHLWRPKHAEIPRPPAMAVGNRDMGVLI
jgi:hypothetical protein